jgi:hypothetical protein
MSPYGSAGEAGTARFPRSAGSGPSYWVAHWCPHANTSREIDAAFATLERERPDALFVAFQKSGSFPPPALPGFIGTMARPTPAAAAAQRRRSRPLPPPRRASPVTRITFSTCCAHYPGGPHGCACRSLPPVSLAGRLATSLSRPAQASLTLQPVKLLDRPGRPLSRVFDPASRPAEPLVSYQTCRLLSGWFLPPLVIRAFSRRENRGRPCQGARLSGPGTYRVAAALPL